MTSRNRPRTSLCSSGLFIHSGDHWHGRAYGQADIATYQGADRSQKLLEGAKKEGTLTIYSSATVET